MKLFGCLFVSLACLVYALKGSEVAADYLPVFSERDLGVKGVRFTVEENSSREKRSAEIFSAFSALGAVANVFLMTRQPKVAPSVIEGIARNMVYDHSPWDLDAHEREYNSMGVERAHLSVPYKIHADAGRLPIASLPVSVAHFLSTPTGIRSSGEMRFSEMLNRPIFLPLQTPCFRIVIKTGLQKVARGQLFQMGHYYLLGDDSRAISERRTRRWPVSFRSTAVTQQAKT